MSYYYHAGSADNPQDPDSYTWSGCTHDRLADAEAEARALADARGGRAMVESWERGHGRVPGCADAVAACWEVMPE